MSESGVTSEATRWWEALNPPIYLVSVLPGLTVLPLADQDDLHGNSLLLATVAVVLLQHAINVLNDVSDWRLGADMDKHDSWVRVHDENLRLATLHGSLSFAAGALLGLMVLIDDQKTGILWYATPLVALGYLYNSGDRPLSYTHLGEWVTGLCYGPGVFGCLWLVANQPLNTGAILGMIAFAALATGVLLSHQPPQIETDRDAGKRSFAVRYGAESTYRGARVLWLIFTVGMGAAIWITDAPVLVQWGYGVPAVITTVLLFRGIPDPRRILLSATGIIVVSVAAQTSLNVID